MKSQSQWDEIQRFCWRHFASDLQRAKHYLRKTDRIYSRLIAEKSRRRNEAQDLSGEWQAVREDEQAEVNHQLTLYWLRRASRHYLPEPDSNDIRYWKHDEIRGVFRLTNEGIDFIEDKLYKKRQRHWEMWIKFATVVTGIIGAATGFAAILFRH